MALQTKDPSTAAISSVGTAGSGGTTNSTKPVIIGTADAGNIVVIYDGIKPLGSVVAGADGKWTFTPTADLKGGAHNFAAIAHDTAGNFGASSAVVNVTIASAAIAQPTAPTFTNDAGLPIVAGSTTNDAHPHINGNGTAGDIIKVLDNGNVIGSTTIGADGKWSFTPSPNLPSGDHAITVIETNPAGTTSSPASNPIHITIDTSTPATPSTPTMTDEGGATIVPGGTTNDPHPHINGNGTAGDTITVYDGGKEIGSTTVKPDGSWSFTPSPDLTPGNHDITVIETNPAGTPSTPSDPIHIVIDTAIPAKPDTPILTDDGGTLIPAGSTANTGHPHISGKGTAGDIITVYDGASAIGTVKIGSDGKWTFTPTTDLSTGSHSISVTDTNAAGTTGPKSDAIAFTFSLVSGAPLITSVDDAVGTITGPIVNGGVTDDSHPTVSGTGVAGYTVYIYQNGAGCGEATVDATGHWTLRLSGALSDGLHVMTAVQFTGSGAKSVASNAWTITVNTSTPATPSAPTMTDEGGATIVPGGTTNDPHPHINGNGTAGDTITVYDGGKEIGSTTVKPDGSWSFTPSPDLSPGNHDITVIETNPAGTPSATSDPIHVVIDTSIPAAPAVPVLTDESGTPIPAGSTTADGHPHIGGTGKAGDIITVYDGATPIGSVKIGTDGKWTFTPTPDLSNAAHSITVTDTNAAGTTGPHSGAFSFTVDSVAPAAPAITGAADYNQGGTLIAQVPSGSLIAYPTVKIGGTAAANAVVYVYDGATLIGSSQADASGAWGYSKTNYSNGAHDLSVTQKSAAGVESGHSNHWSFTVDTSTPAKPTAPTLTDDNGLAIPAGSTTADVHPHINGTGTAGDIIKVLDNGVVIGSTTVNPDGKWSFTPSPELSSGNHDITTTETNAAGTTSPASNPTHITIDTSIPAKPTVPVMTDEGGATIPSGSTTRDGHPHISGTGAAGDVIKVYDNSTLIGSAVIDSTGHWTFTPTSDVSSGTHNLYVTETNAAGTVSPQSDAFSFNYSLVPGSPVITGLIDHTISNGSVPTGGSTFDSAPTVKGVLSDTLHIGETVQVYRDGTAVGVATVTGTGWSFTDSGVAVGAHYYTAQVQSSLANSAMSSKFYFTETASSLPDTSGATLGLYATSTVAAADTFTFVPFGRGVNSYDPWMYVNGVATYGSPKWLYTVNAYTQAGVLVSTLINQATYDLQVSYGGQPGIGVVKFSDVNPNLIYVMSVQASTTGPVYLLDAHSGAEYLAKQSTGTVALQYSMGLSELPASLVGSQTVSAMHQVVAADDAAQVVAATDHSTVDANGVHHTAVETDGTFHGTAANGNETVDLNVDPTAYFKQATAHIEGSKGAAIDTLHLTGDHQVLDLTSLTGQTAAAKVSGIEVVDLGGAHNTLKLSLVDVLNLGETDLFQHDGKQQMMVKGAEGDTVDLSNSHVAGLAEGEWQAHGTTQVGGVTYNVYEHSSANAELLVEHTVRIEMH